MIESTTGLRETSGPTIDWRAALRDFFLALVVVGALLGVVTADVGHAFPLPPPAELGLAAMSVAGDGATFAEPVAFKVLPPTFGAGTNDDRQEILIMLSLSLAVLFAFNATVWRHLRLSYAVRRV